MTTEIRLDTIADFAALTPAQFERMLPDFAVWHELASIAAELGADIKSTRFTWIDDGKPGNIAFIRVIDPETGETMEYREVEASND